MPFSASSYKCSSQLFMDWLHAISTTLSPSSCHTFTQHQTFSMHPPTIVNQSRNRCIGQDPILKLNMSRECHVLVCNIAFGTLSAPFFVQLLFYVTSNPCQSSCWFRFMSDTVTIFADPRLLLSLCLLPIAHYSSLFL